MPSSVLLIAGLLLIVAGVLLLREWSRLRRQVEATRRVLDRSRAAIDETERVKRARDEVLGIADDAESTVVRRSYDAIAGVPLALLEATPMPKDAMRLLRGAHGMVANGVYSTLWGIDRTVGLGIIDTINGNAGKREHDEE